MTAENKHKKMSKLMKAMIIILSLILLFVIISLIFVDNKNIEYEDFELSGANVDTEQAVNIKIVHLSDMHFPKVKVNTDKLLKNIKEQTPDLIAITGDLIDDGAKVNTCGVKEFIEALKIIAPVYYANGNHEERNKQKNELYDFLENSGIFVLRNKSVNITVKDKNLSIIGLEEGSDYSDSIVDNVRDIAQNYKILLAHKPEKWGNYSSQGNVIKPDLVLSGHAHGGQFRMFGQGFIAPGQGLFPKYDAGLYVSESGQTRMILSRGIGNSVLPYRFNNKPHVPVITVLL